jgi:adenine-specific DNA-methyltransferase
VAKLGRWSEDLKFGLEHEIKDLDQEIRDMKRTSTSAASLAGKLVYQRTLKDLQTKRNEKRRGLFQAQVEVDARRDSLF